MLQSICSEKEINLLVNGRGTSKGGRWFEEEDEGGWRKILHHNSTTLKLVWWGLSAASEEDPSFTVLKVTKHINYSSENPNIAQHQK